MSFFWEEPLRVKATKHYKNMGFGLPSKNAQSSQLRNIGKRCVLGKPSVFWPSFSEICCALMLDNFSHLVDDLGFLNGEMNISDTSGEFFVLDSSGQSAHLEWVPRGDGRNDAYICILGVCFSRWSHVKGAWPRRHLFPYHENILFFNNKPMARRTLQIRCVLVNVDDSLRNAYFAEHRIANSLHSIKDWNFENDRLVICFIIFGLQLGGALLPLLVLTPSGRRIGKNQYC